jgi:hypothetical protein
MCYEYPMRHLKSLGGWNIMFEVKPINMSSKKSVLV